MLVLGIETSCDDTAVAVVRNGNEVLSNLVSSQIDLHRRFGGIVPEIASRKHLELLVPLLDASLREAGKSLVEIQGIAVTQGPGLSGSLLMGLCLAKVLALTHQIPLIAVNHLEGHLFATRIDHPQLEPPFLYLLVSGGHTSLYGVREWGSYRLLGKTRDDAAGEAFDKVAKYLELGYPGGPLIDRLSREGEPGRFRFRGGLESCDSGDFSFSGLKTAVVRRYASLPENRRKERKVIYDLVASFQETVIRTLVNKTLRAARQSGFETIVLGGGVAANSRLREVFPERTRGMGITIAFPSLSLCTDNAAMIASCGTFHLLRGETSDVFVEPEPRLALG
ncbi:MAG TPA: tRNA (adenosine(37)-N6)-threonylcarbamoyltransferase complex transferase subunit TsaD [Atribacteraceae bacterium]|nr:tRNA (adenosine(37)-N6)-threonylcarbamoyltransferase complex transferase subunit TsaD [Atribacteraceae bacterium]